MPIGNSFTVLNPGVGGDNIYDEDIGGVPDIKMEATKIHTGTLGIDGGPVIMTNPFPIAGGTVQSANNSSTTPLAGGGSFVGVADDLQAGGYVEVDVNLAGTPAAAPLTVFFEYSPDGANWDVSIPLPQTGPSMVPFPTRAVLRFFRVRVVNGATALASMRLTTTLHKTSSARLTRLLSQLINAGNEPIEVVGAALMGQAGSNGRILTDSNLWTKAAVRLAPGDDWSAATLDLSLWTPTATGSATQALSNSTLTLSTGVTANSTMMVQSIPRGVYLAGTDNNFQTHTSTTDLGTVNNVRRWGAYDTNNGYRFELNGTTFQIVTRFAGVDTPIPTSQWNGLPGYVYNTNLHRYEITYFGNAAFFWIDGVLAHQIASGASVPTSGNLSLPVTFENNNSGGLATALNLNIRGTRIERRGTRNEGSGRFRRLNAAATTVLKSSPGMLSRVVIANVGINGATVEFFDNTAGSGTVIVDFTLSTGGSAQSGQGTYEFNVDFSIGLTVVITGATPPDITVMFE